MIKKDKPFDYYNSDEYGNIIKKKDGTPEINEKYLTEPVTFYRKSVKNKVITIKTNTAHNMEFEETEYPKLNQYFEEGYQIKDIKVVENSESHKDSKNYAMTFILEKNT